MYINSYASFFVVSIFLQPVPRLCQSRQNDLPLFGRCHGNHSLWVHGVLCLKDVWLKIVLGLFIGLLVFISLLKGCQSETKLQRLHYYRHIQVSKTQSGMIIHAIENLARIPLNFLWGGGLIKVWLNLIEIRIWLKKLYSLIILGNISYCTCKHTVYFLI